MTIVVLQATAARRVWHSDPARAREHADVLRATVAETLGGPRELIVSLAFGATEADIGLDRLDALADIARSAGLLVELSFEGQPAPGCAAVERAAYRIVQEALTNAAGHAPGADVIVRVGCAGSGVVLDIENGSPPRNPAGIPGSGHGLRGMRERALACGGELHAGPRPDGGFRVHTQLAPTPPAVR